MKFVSMVYFIIFIYLNIFMMIDIQLCKQISKSTPGFFAFAVGNGKWHYPKHISLIDKELCRLIYGDNTRLIINMPPRHGKSEFISKFFPAWFLGMFPDKRVILTSYESMFAASWGRQVRDILDSIGKNYFGIELNESARSVSSFKIKGHTGGMDCVGAGGAITGKGADLLIIDDPVKNDIEANSPTYRDNVWDWFKSTAYTRLEPGGKIVLIMTRWHEDDLCGRIIDHSRSDDTEDWTILNLPAIAELNDAMGRLPNEVLWSQRFSAERLNKIKATLGSYWFSALYQQRPTPLGGGIFKLHQFKYFEFETGFIKYRNAQASKVDSLEHCSIYAVMDPAVAANETSDYTVILVFAANSNKDIFILDLIRERFEGAEHIRLLRNINDKWRPLLIGVESVQYQRSIIQTGLREGLPIKELKADKDKVSRALPMQALLEAGKVYMKRDALWLHDFENELCQFPNSKHDDQVDAFSYISQMINPYGSHSPAGAGSIRSSIVDLF